MPFLLLNPARILRSNKNKQSTASEQAKKTASENVPAAAAARSSTPVVGFRSPVRSKSRRAVGRLEKKRSLQMVIQGNAAASTRSIATMETTLTRSSTYSYSSTSSRAMGATPSSSKPSSSSSSAYVPPPPLATTHTSSSSISSKTRKDTSANGLDSSSHSVREAAALMGGKKKQVTPEPATAIAPAPARVQATRSSATPHSLGVFLNGEFQNQTTHGRLETVGEQSVCTESVDTMVKDEVPSMSPQDKHEDVKKTKTPPEKKKQEEPSDLQTCSQTVLTVDVRSGFRRPKKESLLDDDDEEEPPSPLFAPRRVRPQLNRGGQFVPPSLKTLSNHSNRAAATSSTTSLNTNTWTGASSNSMSYMSSIASMHISEYENILIDFQDSARSLLVEESSHLDDNVSVSSVGSFGSTKTTYSGRFPGPPPLTDQGQQTQPDAPDLDRMSSADRLIHRYEQILNECLDSSRSLLADKDKDTTYMTQQAELLAPPSPMPELRRNGSGFASVKDMTTLLSKSEFLDENLDIKEEDKVEPKQDENTRPTSKPKKEGAVITSTETMNDAALSAPKLNRRSLLRSSKRPMLTRGGAVKSHQESYIGRSTRNLLGDLDEMLDEWDDLLDEFNDSTRSVQRRERREAEEKVAAAAVTSSMLVAPSVPGVPQTWQNPAMDDYEDDHDDENQLPVSKFLTTPKPRRVLNRGGAFPVASSPQESFFVRSTKALISEYDTILDDFNDSARKVGDDKSVSSCKSKAGVDTSTPPPPSLIRDISNELKKNPQMPHYDRRSKRCIV